MADSARIRTVSFCPRVYKKPRSTHAKLSWVDLGLIVSSGMLISQGATMYSTRSGATPRSRASWPSSGRARNPRGKRKGGRKAPEKRGRGPAAPPLRAPCPRWGRSAPCASAASRPPADRIRSTLGDGGLSCRVRDGIGRNPTSVAALAQGAPCAVRQALRGRPGGRIASFGRRSSSRDRPPREAGVGKQELGLSSTARLNASRRLQLRPIDLVVYEGPYRRENSSRRRLPA